MKLGLNLARSHKFTMKKLQTMITYKSIFVLVIIFVVPIKCVKISKFALFEECILNSPYC